MSAPSDARRSAGDPDTDWKVAFLSDRHAYAHAPSEVRVEETHMSWVFLAGDRVYKLKKPVRHDFLDFGTLAGRRRAVMNEIRLNRRLAPDVYLGARALRRDGQRLSIEGKGQVVDWLVEMRRLPERATLEVALREGRATRDHVAGIANRLVAFYRSLPPVPVTAAAHVGMFQQQHATTVAILTDPALGFGGERLSPALAVFAEAFRAAHPLLCQRVREAKIVEGHGDLRPEHIFLGEPPIIIDCLEFNRMLRSVDPFDEIAFLGLECARLGAGWLVADLVDRIAQGLDDRPDPRLLAFYWRYRALLRARLALVHLTDPVVRTPQKWRPLAREYLDLAEEAELRLLPRRGR